MRPPFRRLRDKSWSWRGECVCIGARSRISLLTGNGGGWFDLVTRGGSDDWRPRGRIMLGGAVEGGLGEWDPPFVNSDADISLDDAVRGLEIDRGLANAGGDVLGGAGI